MAQQAEFQPNWYSPPGDTIVDVLESQGLSIDQFARMMERSENWAGELISGNAQLTENIAQRLANVIGGSASFWLQRETQYREDFARIHTPQDQEQAREWVRHLPIKDMKKFGWLDPSLKPSDLVAACLKFFDVLNIEAWHAKYNDMLRVATFRTSPTFDSTDEAVSAWLRQGEIEGAQIKCKKWNPNKFEKSLAEIRALTQNKNPESFIPKLQEICGECGVAVVIARAPSGCRASGATCFLSPDKALLLLSFRYLSDDHFWFSFFHEAGHLLLHGDKALFLEGPDMEFTDEEREANDFAANQLIPDEFKDELHQLTSNYKRIIRFSKRVGVSPGIVVGQLQHHGVLERNQQNRLKKRFRWE